MFLSSQVLLAIVIWYVCLWGVGTGISTQSANKTMQVIFGVDVSSFLKLAATFSLDIEPQLNLKDKTNLTVKNANRKSYLSLIWLI